MADEVARSMLDPKTPKSVNVRGKAERTGTVAVDFQRLIAFDTLISAPPRSVTDDLSFIGWVNDKVDFLRFRTCRRNCRRSQEATHVRRFFGLLPRCGMTAIVQCTNETMYSEGRTDGQDTQ